MIFMVMEKEKHTRHLRIRLTESQFKRLINRVIEEEKTKSQLIREIIKKHLEEKNYGI